MFLAWKRNKNQKKEQRGKKPTENKAKKKKVQLRTSSGNGSRPPRGAYPTHTHDSTTTTQRQAWHDTARHKH